MTMKMTMAEFVGLEPCPFCGGESTVERIGKSGYLYIACNTAYCCDFGRFDTESEAIAAWNTRAERTCKIIEWYEARDRHEIGNNRVRFSCGDFGTCHDKFCPECGARVVGK